MKENDNHEVMVYYTQREMENERETAFIWGTLTGALLSVITLIVVYSVI